ncbi:MAG: S9 family peptidase [Tannerellaceae bacterium]|jgi:dipeptidyl aminopeptidase/acylaminoacyl peptidase|nr:S9 family peptidase [Tannerellaceae bacterium]
MKKYRLIIALAAGVYIFPSGNSQNITKADYQRADSVMKRNEKVYHSYVRPHWIDNTHEFWYINHEKTGNVYYIVNADTGKKRKVEKQQDESTIQRRLPRTHRDTTKVISPDKQWEAFIRDNNLYVRPVGAPGEIIFSYDGTARSYYSSQIVWSPDSRKLATLRIHDVEERRIPLLQSSPDTQLQPILHWRDYAKPGDPLPVHLPVLFDMQTRKQIPLATQAYKEQFQLYISGWRKDSRAFTFEYNQRGHQRYVVGEVDANSGAIRHIVDEQSSTFIYYNNLQRIDLQDGRQMLWLSERDGWKHIYHIDMTDGQEIRQITRGEWVVRSIEHVDESAAQIYFYASGINHDEDPYNRHLYRINLDGSGMTDLTPGNATHEVTFSKDRKYYTDVYSRPDLPPVSLLRRTSDASQVVELERSDISELLSDGYQPIEVFRAKGRDNQTDIWGNIHRPTNFDSSKTYPVIEFIYAGPHDSHVDKTFKAAHHLVSKLVELGFIVVSIDGMGTSNRSKAFHDVCWKNIKDAGFPDRKQWIREAARKYTYIDTTRVGIYGWSAGGQNAMAALLFHNEFYKAAVSFCGCHDNRMDKIWWNEQWMGYPTDSSYIASSNVANAFRLKGSLLLINGELDDNVDPASTLQVINALVKANKSFEQLYLPSRGHSLGGPYEIHKLQDFFVRKLWMQEPPEWE